MHKNQRLGGFTGNHLFFARFDYFERENPEAFFRVEESLISVNAGGKSANKAMDLACDIVNGEDMKYKEINGTILIDS
ncbi:MAG: hypothetical protein ACRDBX_03150 [Erysipelotrichaceae bacterium]